MYRVKHEIEAIKAGITEFEVEGKVAVHVEVQLKTLILEGLQC